MASPLGVWHWELHYAPLRKKCCDLGDGHVLNLSYCWLIASALLTGQSAIACWLGLCCHSLWRSFSIALQTGQCMGLKQERIRAMCWVHQQQPLSSCTHGGYSLG